MERHPDKRQHLLHFYFKRTYMCFFGTEEECQCWPERPIKSYLTAVITWNNRVKETICRLSNQACKIETECSSGCTLWSETDHYLTIRFPTHLLFSQNCCYCGEPRNTFTTFVWNPVQPITRRAVSSLQPAGWLPTAAQYLLLWFAAE